MTATWNQNCDALVAFFNTFECVPLHDTTDDPKEQALGLWANQQCNDFANAVGDMALEANRVKWEAVMNYYPFFIPDNAKSETTWTKTKDSVLKWVRRRQRAPRRCAIRHATSAKERGLYEWLLAQFAHRDTSSGPMADAATRNTWDDLVANPPAFWDMNMAEITNHAWELNLFNMQAYLKKSQLRNPPPTDDAMIAWIGRQCADRTQQTGHMTSSRHRSNWDQTVRTFHPLLGEPASPSSFSDDESDKEKEEDDEGDETDHAAVASRAMEAAKALPAARPPRNAMVAWSDMLSDVKDFLTTHGVAPEGRSVATHQGRLLQWIYCTRARRKKHQLGMKSVERCLAWDTVVRQFSPLLGALCADSELLMAPTIGAKRSLEEPATNTDAAKKNRCGEMTKWYGSMESSALHRHFSVLPDAWTAFHADRANERVASDLVIARMETIRSTRRKLVADLGCGVGRIAEHFESDPRFSIRGFDHVAHGPETTCADITDLSEHLADDSVEIVVISLAMWGPNCEKIVCEAARVLETGGKLILVDTPSQDCAYTAALHSLFHCIVCDGTDLVLFEGIKK
jgi:hypothetical protein